MPWRDGGKMKILLTVSYVGSGYLGYQVQRNADTIQGKLNEATRALFGFDCDIVGCSRTDKGVHANMFCAAVSKRGETGISSNIPEGAIRLALNTFLPKDICVLSARYVEESFHPRYDVKKKEYIYKILNRELPDPFLHGRAWHYTRMIDDAALQRMNRAAAYFVGKHDFRAFMASGSSVKSTEREVFSASVYREGDIIIFSVEADGFLYNMVRIMMGTLIAVAEGKTEPEEIPEIILSGNRSRAGMTVCPDGLYLNKVEY